MDLDLVSVHKNAKRELSVVLFGHLFCLVTAGPQEHEICAVQSGPGILQSLRRLNNHKSKMINIWKDTWIDRVE